MSATMRTGAPTARRPSARPWPVRPNSIKAPRKRKGRENRAAVLMMHPIAAAVTMTMKKPAPPKRRSPNPASHPLPPAGLVPCVLEPVKNNGRPTGEYQEILLDPGVADKRLLGFEPEFASTLLVMGRDGNILSAIVRQAWDGPNLSGLAKNSPGKSTGAHISIIAHITKEELVRYLDRTEAANGFGNRFLWVCVRRSKLLPEGGRLNEVDFTSFLSRLSEAVNFATQAGRISFDEESRGLWREVYGPLSEGKPGMFGALVSRAEAQVVRLACIYALLDQSKTIRPVLMTSQKYATGDPMADQILAALRDAPGGLSQTDINNLFGRNLPSGRIHQALNLLLNQRLVVAESRETGGRRAIIWKAVTK